MGGNSLERAVSLQTGEEMMKHLNLQKYEIIPITIPENHNTDWIITLIQIKPDLVLSALHGGMGEDGSMQGLLECLHIHYVGTKVLGSAVGMDKYLSKMLMKMHHIPVAEDVFIPWNEHLYPYEEKIIQLGFPLVVKPNKGGSSIGISIVHTLQELTTAVEVVQKLKDDILVEKYIEGREVTCGIIETEDDLKVLTVLDISTDKIFYDYAAKYEDETTRIHLSTLPEFLQIMIRELAKKVFQVLHCRGYGRVDLIVKEEQVIVMEINTLPGMTSHSLIPKAAAGLGMDFSTLLDELIQNELKNMK